MSVGGLAAEESTVLMVLSHGVLAHAGGRYCAAWSPIMSRSADRPAIGWREWIELPDLGVGAIKAKVDTGAKSSSLHAWDIETDDHTGLVRFSVHPLQDDDTWVIAATAPLVDHREVRSSNGEVDLRPVIRTTATIRGAQFEIELSLSRRDEMGFRMLLGRSAIKRRFVVDPGRSFVGGGDRFSRPS